MYATDAPTQADQVQHYVRGNCEAKASRDRLLSLHDGVRGVLVRIDQTSELDLLAAPGHDDHTGTRWRVPRESAQQQRAFSPVDARLPRLLWVHQAEILPWVDLWLGCTEYPGCLGRLDSHLAVRSWKFGSNAISLAPAATATAGALSLMWLQPNGQRDRRLFGVRARDQVGRASVKNAREKRIQGPGGQGKTRAR